MQKHDYVLTFCIDMFVPLLISWNNQVAYSNEITHIYICTKLHVYMWLKLERHKDFKRHWKKRFVSLSISQDP
jgi:hypothetical protein